MNESNIDATNSYEFTTPPTKQQFQNYPTKPVKLNDDVCGAKDKQIAELMEEVRKLKAEKEGKSFTLTTRRDVSLYHQGELVSTSQQSVGHNSDTFSDDNTKPAALSVADVPSSSNGAIVSGSNGSNEGGWSSSILQMITESPSTSSSNSTRSPVTIEVTLPITDKKTNELVYIILFSNLGRKGWYFRGQPISAAFEKFFSGSNGIPASVYSSFTETFIRGVSHGPNVYQRRKSKSNDNGSLPYPTTKLMAVLRLNKMGYGLEIYLKKFEDSIRRMMSNGIVPAHYLLELFRNDIPGLYNGFMSGAYRAGDKKNKAYASEAELKSDMKCDFEETFRNGFGRVTKDCHLDKFLCDYEIKAHLLSLGYNSFESVHDDEMSHIYRSGNFPAWNQIEQEPISG